MMHPRIDRSSHRSLAIIQNMKVKSLVAPLHFNEWAKTKAWIYIYMLLFIWLLITIFLFCWWKISILYIFLNDYVQSIYSYSLKLLISYLLFTFCISAYIMCRFFSWDFSGGVYQFFTRNLVHGCWKLNSINKLSNDKSKVQ